MIKLNVEPYCHHCSDFEPAVSVLHGYGMPWEQTVTCVNRDKCKGIERYIRAELEKKEKENAQD